MIVNDLIDLLIKYKQEEDSQFAVSEKEKEYYLSGKYRNIIKSELLEKAAIIATREWMELRPNWKEPNIMKVTQEVNEGYWLYIHYLLDDYWTAQWYPDYETAKEYYGYAYIGAFLEKVLLHTDKGILMSKK